MSRCDNCVSPKARNRARGCGVIAIDGIKRPLATCQKAERKKLFFHHARQRFQVETETRKPKRRANCSQRDSLGAKREAQSKINKLAIKRLRPKKRTEGGVTL